MYKKLSGWLRFLWLRPQIKVFQMNDYDWVAARNSQTAKFYYLESTGLDAEDAFGGEEPAILSRTDMKKLRYGCDTGNTISFRAQLNQCIMKGEEFPQLFASTEY